MTTRTPLPLSLQHIYTINLKIGVSQIINYIHIFLLKINLYELEISIQNDSKWRTWNPSYNEYIFPNNIFNKYNNLKLSINEIEQTYKNNNLEPKLRAKRECITKSTFIKISI